MQRFFSSSEFSIEKKKYIEQKKYIFFLLTLQAWTYKSILTNGTTATKKYQ